MRRNSNRNALLVIAVIAILLLASLIGNVILLGLLNKANRQLVAVKTELTDTQYELAQMKSGVPVPESSENEPAATAEPGTEPEAEPTEPGAEISGTEPVSAEPTPVPTAEPTATPEPTPAGPYAASKLDYEPLDSEKLPEKMTGTVTCTVDVNIRSGPGTNYGKLASVSSGAQLNVYASAYGWFLIEYKKNIYGWISGQYFFGDWMFESGLNSFLKDIEAPHDYLSAPEKVVVTAENGANARCGAATAKDLVSRLENGDTGICIGTTGDWRLCNFKGTYGWVHKSNFA